MAEKRMRVRGMIIGIAVGDALGLPAEGMSPGRAEKRFPGPLRHRFFRGRGMVSDDTDHAFLTAQCLLAHPDSPSAFERGLAWRLRGWLMTLPAGTGWATLRACLRLWVGISPAKSGVFSAGNGPLLRALPIGAFFSGNPAMRSRYAEIAVRITHTDPKALIGAKAAADLIAWTVERGRGGRPSAEEFLGPLEKAAPDDPEWKELLQTLEKGFKDEITVREYARRLGLSRGVTGYIYHTLPVALYAAYRHWGDFGKSLGSVLSCGGDTDSTGAVVGAVAGAGAGESEIPKEWIDGIWEWPRNVSLLRRLGDALYRGSENPRAASPVSYCRPGLIPRNLFFTAVVLGHGFRRCFPPY